MRLLKLQTQEDLAIRINTEIECWLVSADMGYGHQRAIYPLRKMAYLGEIINANTTSFASNSERKLWARMLNWYEFMSKAGKIPVIGKYFELMLNKLLHIPKYYPFRDLSASTSQVKMLKRSIQQGLCKGIVTQIASRQIPFLTSFYSSAIAADAAGYKQVYCIICDTDLNRVWVAENATESNITYFAPNSRATGRLTAYGVRQENIVLTGFPLPLELLGNRNLDILKRNLLQRLKRLDASNRFYPLYGPSVETFIGKNQHKAEKSITITFAVGGAGAQKEIGRAIAKSLKHKIIAGEVKLNLVAGTKVEVWNYFDEIHREILNKSENACVVFAPTNQVYFDKFNEILHQTDILWTKPSELSFYCALGIPIIMTPAIGPQEICNRRWLREIGAGIKQGNPKYTHQWLFELLRKGLLAEAGWNGFLKARKYGTFKIMDYLNTGGFENEYHPLKR